ncbi:hypothetical protein AYX14_05095 [Cryptococcus neoformans]|nr:hypothetical protein AYX14_05095 [Cryptococcus neoformans var. grubii]
MRDCVVRGCTIHGNGQANNHDVTAWLAQAGTCAHLITVGLFATETGIWEASNKVLVILYICFLVLSLLFSGYPIPSDPTYSMMLNTGGMIGTSSTQSGPGDAGHIVKKRCTNCCTKGNGSDPLHRHNNVCSVYSVHKSLYHFAIIFFQSLEDDEQKGILEFYAQRATVEEDQKDQVESMWKSICWENGREVGIGIT